MSEIRIHSTRFFLLATLFVAAVFYEGIAQAHPATFIAPDTPSIKHLTQASAAEVAFWETVRNSKNPEEIEAYLQAYPNGVFAPLAHIRVKALRAKSALSAPVTKQPETNRTIEQPKQTDRTTDPPAGTYERHELRVRVGERAGTRQGMIGVNISNLLASVAKGLGLPGTRGAFVNRVTQNSAAQLAGLKPLDTILSFDGRPINDFRKLARLTKATPPGTGVRIEILRPSGGHAGLMQRLQIKIGQGDADAITALGWLHETGSSVARDDRKAVGLYRRSAEAGNPTAMFRLGVLVEAGRGGSADTDEAIAWYRKAAEGGTHQAMYALARNYATGRGVRKDQAEAVRWYRKAAEKGNASAMYALGVRYANGTVVKKDDAEAVIWFRRAAEKDHAFATDLLGHMYRFGRGVYRDEAQALRLFRKAIDLGSTNALFHLGRMLQAGKGTTKDEAEAVRLYRRASDLKHTNATAALAHMYQHGKGVTKDYNKAFRLYHRAAEKNNQSAFHQLGWMYFHGHGTSKNHTKSVKWYRKSASLGVSDSMINLAIAFETGRGVPKSSRMAAGWAFKSLEKGNKFAFKQMTENNRVWSKTFRRELQRRLKDAGYYNGPIDGSFGSSTKSAIQALVN